MGGGEIGMESKTRNLPNSQLPIGSRAFFGGPFRRPFPASSPPFFPHERGVSRSDQTFCMLRSGLEEKAFKNRRPEGTEWSIFQAPTGADFTLLPPALPLAHLPPLFSHTRTAIQDLFFTFVVQETRTNHGAVSCWSEMGSILLAFEIALERFFSLLA